MTDLVGTGLTLRPLPGAVPTEREAGEAFAVAEICGYIGSDGKVYKADADAASTAAGQLLIRVAGNKANTAGTLESGEWATWILFGPIAGWTGLDETAQAFLSGTAGKLADAAGTVVRPAGWPLSETVLNFMPGDNRTSS